MESLISFLCPSSDEDDWSEEELILKYIILDEPKQKIRVQNFVTDVVDKYSDEEFKENFRVTKETADFLTSKFERSEFYKSKVSGGIKGFTARAQMLSFLWFSGNKTTYREVSNLFHMSLSTMHRHLNLILDFFFNLSPKFIRFPISDDEKNKTASEFEKISGLKNVLGCIDGSYIYIRKPAHKIKSTYINRHDLLSITLQVICDSNKKFIDVFVGSPSKIHDSRVFELSHIRHIIPEICGADFHILGDAAYPLREYILTPYKAYGTLTHKQERYNLKHCQTRVKIENAFGLLKQRFRQLIRLDFFGVDTMCKFVLACCVLHNMCIDRNDCILEESSNTFNSELHSDEEDIQMETVQSQKDSLLRRLGELKRNSITDSL